MTRPVHGKKGRGYTESGYPVNQFIRSSNQKSQAGKTVQIRCSPATVIGDENPDATVS
jgi:hypothetical protein